MNEIALETCDTAISELLALLNKGELLVITRQGRPCYVLEAIDDIEQEVLALSRSEELRRYLDAARARRKPEGTISLAEARQRLGGK